MEPEARPSPGDGTDSGRLESRFRRIRRIALLLGVLWVLVVAISTVWISDRILAGTLADVSERAGRDATTMSSTVDRLFHELTSISQVLSNSADLHAIVVHYNSLEREFSTEPREQRYRELANDRNVSRVGERMSRIRNVLDYDLIYALDSRGIRIVSSEWDRPVELLGTSLDDREYFREAIKGTEGFMFGIGRTTHVPVFYFSAPIVGEAGSPIGVVVVREDAAAIGELLQDSRRIALMVDAAGMVVASNSPQFTMRHVGVLAQTQPSAQALRDTYGQEKLQSLVARRPPRALNADDWLIDGDRYLVSRARLDSAPGYGMLVLTPIDWLATLRAPHMVIGVLAALFGLLLVMLASRRASDSARRRHEARAIAALNRKLSALNQEKDRFLGIAAHDLRNPLSSMRGLSQLMLEMPLEPAQQREFLETIQRTSNEALALVNDLLDVSVIESGRLELRRGEHDVAELVRQRLRHQEPHARRKDIGLQFETEGALPASIDPARFSQVIDNLTSNAIKYSPPGSVVRVTLRPAGGRFELAVKDEGPGISEEDRTKLFRSFQTLSARPTGGEKATGLGLAIVKKIVDAHDGTIDVESEPGAGSRFTVSLPLQAAKESS